MQIKRKELRTRNATEGIIKQNKNFKQKYGHKCLLTECRSWLESLNCGVKVITSHHTYSHLEKNHSPSTHYQQ